MIDGYDDAEPSDAEYSHDGGYVPRILFLHASSGKVLTDIYNVKGNEKFKYFYFEPNSIEEAMKEALRVHGMGEEL